MQVIYIGTELGDPIKNWQEMVDAPRCPRTTKQETFEAKLPELWAKLEQDAREDVALSTIRTFEAIAGDDGEFLSVGPRELDKFVNMVDDRLHGHGTSVLLVGVRSNRQLTRIAYELIRQKKTAPQWLFTPYSFYGLNAPDNCEVMSADIRQLVGLGAGAVAGKSDVIVSDLVAILNISVGGKPSVTDANASYMLGNHLKIESWG